jgi:hypothetical protein
MESSMTGFYEARIDGPGARQYRLFCVLEDDEGKYGLGGPSVVIVAGLDTPAGLPDSDHDLAQVRALRAEYLCRRPRPIVK